MQADISVVTRGRRGGGDLIQIYSMYVVAESHSNGRV